MENIAHALTVAREHHAAGRFAEAEAVYRQILASAPDHAEAQNNLGACLNAQGNTEAALTCFREALRVRADFLAARVNLARTLHHVGRLEEAVTVYQEAVRQQPEGPEHHLGMGQALRDLERTEEALASLCRALELWPHHAEAHNELGLALVRAGRLEEALARFQDATRLRPGFAAAYTNCGNVLKRLGRWAESERALLYAVRSDPADAVAHLNLGFFLEQRGERGEALVSYEHAVRAQPRNAEALRAAARLLAELGRRPEAVEALRRLRALDPSDIQAANDLGNVLQILGHYQQAEAVYREALQANPSSAAAHSNLGYLLADQGRVEEARTHYREARRLDPSARLRVVAETMLPPLYGSIAEMSACREQLAAGLDRLDRDGVRIDPTREVLPTLFYLAYHGVNERTYQSALARLGAVSAATPPHPPLSPGGRGAGGEGAPRPGNKIHVGFLSRHLKKHTIGGLTAGLIRHLDRDRFTVTVLSVGRHEDEVAQRIRHSADRYVEVPPHLPAALPLVAGQGLDVLFYPDLGMDPFTYTLAFSRLAPVQCVTWGHPMTTGIPAIDYFVSSEDLDAPGAQDHYTEKLVRLKTPAVFYERPGLRPPPRGRDFFGLPENAHLYTCPQTLFKFHPDFDDLLADILRQDPDGLLVLLEGRYPTWRELLWQRFGRTLPDVRDRVRFLPSQSRESYLHLLAVSDVLLDPVHFGGGNSSYEALALGTPVVTLPSAFLKGRITYALYRKMNVLECVAESTADYTRLALELGRDADRRRAVGRRIRESSTVLFEDHEAVHELERFLQSAMSGPRSPAACG